MFKPIIKFVKEISRNKAVGKGMLDKNISRKYILLWGKFTQDIEVQESLNFFEFLLQNPDLLTDKDFSRMIKRDGLIGILKACQTYCKKEDKEDDIAEKIMKEKNFLKDIKSKVNNEAI